MFKLIASARIGFHYRLRMMECTEEGRCDDGCGRDNNLPFVIHVRNRTIAKKTMQIKASLLH